MMMQLQIWRILRYISVENVTEIWENEFDQKQELNNKNIQLDVYKRLECKYVVQGKNVEQILDICELMLPWSRDMQI